MLDLGKYIYLKLLLRFILVKAGVNFFCRANSPLFLRPGTKWNHLKILITEHHCILCNVNVQQDGRGKRPRDPIEQLVQQERARQPPVPTLGVQVER